jgi:hypothetical protein
LALCIPENDKNRHTDDGQSDAGMPVAIRNLEEQSTRRRMTSARVFTSRESEPGIIKQKSQASQQLA